ncbi:ferritin-like domain-containing protein [Palaeococcus ferrophilus]|uniref:ferritin-like domain-containing protein n=1 Tax=Palaeococcus ferrophilus TaxID=83868 RepID=UPI00064EFABF|nr:ferritin family protein [Palaeococcus ferrophilus]
MSELSHVARDDIKKLLQKLPKLSMKELLSYLVNAEAEEAEMYRHLTEVSREITWSEEIPKVFHGLSEDSIQHAEELLKLYKKLFPGEELAPVDLPPLEVVLGEDKLREFLRHGRLWELFDILMENEKMTAEVYEYIHSVSENPEIREVAKWLAEVEWGHFNKIKILKDRHLLLKDNQTG